MKRIQLVTIGLLLGFAVLAQTPASFTYQAALRNADGSIVANQAATVVIDILQGNAEGTSVFTETHNITTSTLGIVNLTIGSINDLGVVDWSTNQFFIKVTFNGVVLGVVQFLSVPYALHAKTAEVYTETDPAFKAWDKTTGITISESQITDLGTYLETETDPNVTANFDFAGAAVGDLLQFNGTKWEKVTPNYLTSYTETDPAFTAWDRSTGISVTESQILDLGTYVETETDPAVAANFDFINATVGDLLQFDGSKWVKFSPNYLTSFTETDALWSASPSFGIASTNITDWNSAFGWGNHATAGYLTSFTELDPKVGANTTNYISKWNGTALVSSNIFDNGTNVGIGTNAPTSLLHVKGTADPLQIMVENTGGDFKTGYGIKTAVQEWFIGQQSLATTGFRIVDVTNMNAVRLQIETNTGNVGIGTTSPATKLDVNGVITATGGNSTQWSESYSWGNHVTAGYLTSFTEIDPKIGANTTGFSPKWDGASLVTGAIYQDASGNVGIGTNNPNAALEISSTTSGFLIPRMTTAERDLITNPSLGLQIFNITTGCFNVWNGSAWGQICPDCGFIPAAGNNGPLCAGLTLNLSAATIPDATYNWTGPNGFTSAEQNPSIVNATTAASGAYYVTASKDGCTSLPSTTVATVNPSLDAASASYNSPVCVSTTLNLTATTIPGATYTWSGPNNFFSNIQNPSITNMQPSNAGTYYVAATLGGCSSSASVTVTVLPVPSQPGVITGTFTLLPPQTGISYSISPVADATSYTWAYSGTGATITGLGTNSIAIDFACGATSGSLSVTANNSCGGASTVQSQVVSISTLGQPGVITGTTPVVPPQSGFTYSTTAVSGATSYTWTVPASLGTIASGQGTTSITVDFACGASSSLISVTANNSCGSSIARTYTVNIAALGTPGTISGLTNISYPQTGVAYSVAAVAGATSYTWTVPSGATIASGQGSNSILVDYACGAASGNLGVTTSNSCGSSGTNSVSITVATSTPAMPGAISGTNNLPAGVNGMTYSISPVFGATSYTWTVPSGTNIVSGQGTTAIVVNYTCAAASGNVGVSATNACGTSSERTMAITVNASPSQPGAITGPSSVSAGGTGISYSISTVTGATNYTWAYTGTGATITSGQGTTAITVDFDCSATSGNITVNASNACAVPSTNASYAVTISGTVATPGVITGTTTPLVGQNSTPYTVAIVPGATVYTWTVPAGATIASGQGTNSILVDFGCGAVAGNISVAASNTCIGAGTPRTLAINPTSTIPAPGVITGITSVAQGRTGVTYTIAPVTGASTYTWSYTGNGATFASGQGTTTVTVDYACTATSGNISVTASNACIGPSAASNLAVTVNALATPGAISGLISVPQGSTGINYTIVAVPGATSYNWIVPVGATVVFGQGNTSIWVDYGCTVGSGNILVTAANACGSSGGSSLNITISSALPATPGGITTLPTTSIPKGTTNVIHSIAAVTGAASYTWTVPAGATITSGQGTTLIMVDYSCAAVSANVTVVANNACGSSAASTTAMNLMASPSIPGGITGTASVPKGSAGFVYSITPVNGATLYTWTAPTGAYITSGQGTTSITVDYSCTAASGNISVNASNACGAASANRTLAITTTSSLASLGVITGTTSPLLGQAGTPYSVAPITGATTYSWSVPGGATISSGQGTPSIGVDFSCAAVNGTIVVSASNGCVSTSPVSLSFALSSVALTQPAAITGLASVPRGTTSVTYSIASVTGATSYIWTVPANSVITSGQGTTSITVDFSSCSAASGNIGVTASNGCVANSPERTLAVTVTTVALPTPGVITGTQTPVFGQNGVTYSIAAVAGATTYTWSYSGTNANITSGQGSTAITVDYACTATNGNISVTASNGCVATSPARTLAITLTSSLGTPGAISGIQSPIFGQNGVQYSIATVTGATTYTWTASSGATITSGQGTTSITVDFSCTAQTNGTISVVASNACSGPSSPSALSYVMGGSLATPGSISGLATVPKGTSNVAYSVSALNGATSYTWSVPVGCTILSGQGTNAIMVDYSCTATSGNVSVNATNGCTTTPSSTLAVTVATTLAAPGAIAGSTSPVGGSAVNYTIVPIVGATSYNWTAPTGATIVSGAVTNSVYYSFDCSAASGNISVTVNNSCIGAGTSSTLAITPVSASSIGTLGAITEAVYAANTMSYSVVSVGQATYTWTVPTGMTILSGQGSTQIIASFTGNVIGTVGCTVSNGCVSQNSSSSRTIYINEGVDILHATAFGSFGSLQYWTVPAGVTQITIDAYGAQGGNSTGKGAQMKGTFKVTPGQTIKILVGQKGLDGICGGGGGGTFVTDINNIPLIVAGGGSANPAPITNAGNTNGGAGDGCVGGGGGLTGNGGDGASSGGKSFINGGFGGNGCNSGAGGYGGGAGGEWCWCGKYGGGGGYNGGTGNNGGGSYNAGTNQSNTAGANADHGKVIITW